LGDGHACAYTGAAPGTRRPALVAGEFLLSRLPVIVSIVCLVAAALVGGLAWKITHDRPMGARSEAGVSGTVISHGQADVGGPFQLVDQNGRGVDQHILDGKWSVVFFGYTYCPDVCPTTLQTLAGVKQALGPEGEALQVVFVTVDPARDTPAAMKAYLDSVGLKGAIGLSGTPEQIAGAAAAYKIFYARKGEGADYLMDHSTLSYLMGPDGTFRSPVPYGLSVEQTTGIIRDAMQQRS
jgi:protein SCO1/2